jgi:hypothetical protein
LRPAVAAEPPPAGAGVRLGVTADPSVTVIRGTQVSGDGAASPPVRVVRPSHGGGTDTAAGSPAPRRRSGTDVFENDAEDWESGTDDTFDDNDAEIDAGGRYIDFPDIVYWGGWPTYARYACALNPRQCFRWAHHRHHRPHQLRPKWRLSGDHGFGDIRALKRRMDRGHKPFPGFRTDGPGAGSGFGRPGFAHR